MWKKDALYKSSPASRKWHIASSAFCAYTYFTLDLSILDHRTHSFALHISNDKYTNTLYYYRYIYTPYSSAKQTRVFFTDTIAYKSNYIIFRVTMVVHIDIAQTSAIFFFLLKIKKGIKRQTSRRTNIASWC